MYVTRLPVVPLNVAAGAFSDPQRIDDDDFEWTARVATPYSTSVG
jgi:hypothetical protein